jgi:hypothetical protein
MMSEAKDAPGDNGDAQSPKAERSTLGELPKVDFSSLVLSLGTTALFQMGVVPEPVMGETHEMDELAVQQAIDTLEMLREKTLGNLDDEERKLIDTLLYEVRMRFVESKR